MSFRDEDYFLCECCGAELSTEATFCPKCGASPESGWDRDDEAWDAEQPGGYSDDDDFDYDEFVRREFPDRDSPVSQWRLKRVAVAAVIVVLCLTLLFCSLTLR